MIDKELELYYRNIRDMFGSPGWKQLMEDLNSNAMVINSVEAAKDNEDLYFRKGQLAVIANLLNLEAQIDASEAEALKEEEYESVLETDYAETDNAKDSFGDEYNENMLKAIESRKMEYAAVFSDKQDYTGPKTEDPSTASMMSDRGSV